MKLWLVALFGLIPIALSGSVAEAQWGAGTRWTAPGGQLAHAARSFSEEAEHVARFLRSAEGNSPLAADAAALARSAERFHRTVAAGAPARVVASELDGTREELARLSAGVNMSYAARDPHFREDFARMTQAFARTSQLAPATAYRSPARGRRAWGHRSGRYRARTYAAPPSSVRRVPVAPRPGLGVHIRF